MTFAQKNRMNVHFCQYLFYAMYNLEPESVGSTRVQRISF